MAFSLAFHIIFAVIGMAMPFLMAASHFIYLKTHDENYKLLTKAWSKGTAIFFAVGAVSGTALSFELGLLWPKFMEHAGSIIGMPFSWEGTAFFLEAVALGIFLYGWDRVSPWVHWVSGVVVGLSGIASALFVICANAWMNSPTGFDWNNGNPINIDPWAAMFNDAALWQGVHMNVGAFQAVGFAVAGIHAYLWKKHRHRLHWSGFVIALTFGAIASLIQPIVGDFSAKSVARRQPVKLAAMEGLFETSTPAPLTLGGIPFETTKQTKFGIEIPALLSFLAYGDLKATVKGLSDFPQDQWPPVAVTHIAFQIMVGIGSLLALLGLIFLFARWKNEAWLDSPKLLCVFMLATPLGFIAIEAGWVVTEVGRQPWIIYGIMRTSEAVTPRPGVVFSLGLYMIIYSLLTLVVIFLMKRQIQALHQQLVGK